jgi:hypothetical protein
MKYKTDEKHHDLLDKVFENTKKIETHLSFFEKICKKHTDLNEDLLFAAPQFEAMKILGLHLKFLRDHLRERVFQPTLDAEQPCTTDQLIAEGTADMEMLLQFLDSYTGAFLQLCDFFDSNKYAGSGGSGGSGSGGDGSGGENRKYEKKTDDEDADAVAATQKNTPAMPIASSVTFSTLPSYADKLNELFKDFVQFKDDDCVKMAGIIRQLLVAINRDELKKAVAIYNQHSSFFNSMPEIRAKLNAAHPKFGGLEVGDKFRDICFAVEAVVEHINKKIS